MLVRSVSDDAANPLLGIACEYSQHGVEKIRLEPDVIVDERDVCACSAVDAGVALDGGPAGMSHQHALEREVGGHRGHGLLGRALVSRRTVDEYDLVGQHRLSGEVGQQVADLRRPPQRRRDDRNRRGPPGRLSRHSQRSPCPRGGRLAVLRSSSASATRSAQLPSSVSPNIDARNRRPHSIGGPPWSTRREDAAASRRGIARA